MTNNNTSTESKTMIKVTMQKNVLVRTADRAYTFSHKQFIGWLADNGVTEFVFRPGDKGDSLATRRINSLTKAGFNVSESGELHHYMKAAA